MQLTFNEVLLFSTYLVEKLPLYIYHLGNNSILFQDEREIAEKSDWFTYDLVKGKVDFATDGFKDFFITFINEKSKDFNFDSFPNFAKIAKRANLFEE